MCEREEERERGALKRGLIFHSRNLVDDILNGKNQELAAQTCYLEMNSRNR